MSDLLKTGSAWLQERRRAHMTHTVTYGRGDASISDVPATVGKTVFRTDTGYGLFEHTEARDYLIAAADIAGIGTPQRGDRIIETLAGIEEAFVVMAPGNEPCFRYTDRGRAVFRIHAKHVGQA